MIPCIDILSMLCDHVLERVPHLEKLGKYFFRTMYKIYREIPADMYVTMMTLVYAAHRTECEELVTIRNHFEKVYGKEFIKASETNPSNLNETIRENINLIMPEKG